MKGDFSRVTFDPARHFTRVLMQQGRVLVDADWNEQNDLLLHSLRGLAADLVGPHGGPILVDRQNQQYVGFGMRPAGRDLEFFGGRYYVDGLLCELGEVFGEDGSRAPATTFARQPFPTGERLPDGLPYLVYLDAWERHVTALDRLWPAPRPGIEDPPIREVALGGPDTCSRAQVVWQLRLAIGDLLRQLRGADDCANFPLQEFRRALRGHPPTLKAKAAQGAADSGPCITPPDARYRRSENQLYRVEIHEVYRDPARPATFKWSRENGSVVAPWLDRNGNDLVVAGIRDEKRGFAAGDWIELLDDAFELEGRAGVLVKVTGVEQEVLTDDPGGQTLPEIVPEKNPRVRRWDQRKAGGDSTLTGGAVPVRYDIWIPLEDGIEVHFQPPEDGEPARYRTGDYWLIPARVATGDVEWPRSTANEPLPRPPHGVEHHYAPLFLVRATGPTIDLRRGWMPLAACAAGRFGPSLAPSSTGPGPVKRRRRSPGPPG